jgi:cytochrome c551/c552
MIKKIIGISALVLVGLFLVIQLVPYGHKHSNPPVLQEPNWPDAQTRDLAVRACFDCHSNETVWPWYSNIAPISWLVENDVQEGRSRLNFSDWGNNTGREGHELGEISEVINGGRMPPSYFLIMHPNAKLSAAEKQTLVNGLLAASQAAGN